MSRADHPGEVGDLRAPNASRYAWLFAQPLRPASFYAPVWADGPTRTDANTGNSYGVFGRTAESASYARSGPRTASDVMFMAEDTSLAELIGHNIRLARRDLTLSQVKLAGILGVTQREISRWELGGRQPNERSLRLLADALQRPVLWFFDEHPDDE